MAKEWPRIVRIMRDLGRRNEAAPELWSFLEFVVTHRTPLYIVLMPFILHKVSHLKCRNQIIQINEITTTQISQPPIGDHERHMQFLIRERMRGMQTPNTIRSRGALLLELARELRDLRDELEERRYGNLSKTHQELPHFQEIQNKHFLFMISNSAQNSYPCPHLKPPPNR